MKIQDLSVRRFRGEGGGDYSAEIQVVDVTTDEGVTGTGYAAAPPGIGRLMASLLREVLAPCVKGHDPATCGRACMAPSRAAAPAASCARAWRRWTSRCGTSRASSPACR